MSDIFKLAYANFALLVSLASHIKLLGLSVFVPSVDSKVMVGLWLSVSAKSVHPIVLAEFSEIKLTDP